MAKKTEPNKLVMIFRKIKAWFYIKKLRRFNVRIERKINRMKRRMVNDIRKCTGVQLYGWQVNWAFDPTMSQYEYHSEAKYGRKNGKTTANIFRLLLAGLDIYLNFEDYTFSIWGSADHDSALFMKEDYADRGKRHYFVRKIQEYHAALSKSKNKTIKRRLSRLHYGQDSATEKEV